MRFISLKKITIFYLLAATTIICVLWIIYSNDRQIVASNLLVEHTQEVLHKSDLVLLDIINLETGSRGYLLTGNLEFLEPYKAAQKSIQKDIADLKFLTEDNVTQLKRIDSLGILGIQRAEISEKLVTSKSNNTISQKEIVALTGSGKIITDKIRNIIDEINRDEFALLEKRRTEQKQHNLHAQELLLLLLVLVIIVFIMVKMISRRQQGRNEELEAFTSSQKLLSQYTLSLIEASLDPLVTLNTAGKITDLNQATVKITGINREKLIGTYFPDYFTEQEKAREVYKEVFAKGSMVDSPLTLKNKSGKLTDVLLNGSVYRSEEEEVLGIVIVARDVTALNLESQYARSLIEASLDPMFTINPAGKITDVNNASLNITGKTREELISTDFFEYFTEPEKAREGYQEAFAKGFVADYPLTIRDHKMTDVLFNGSVYKDGRNNVLGVVVVARDISEQTRTAKELTEAIVFAEMATKIAEDAKTKAESATHLAEDSVKSKQQFLSNMSHEIRTPMNAIIGFTKVVLKTALTEKQKEYVTAIKISGDALIVLINDILDLAKVDAGKMTFEQVPFKMEISISAMLHLFETKILEKNLELVKVYDKTIPETLVGDPVRLHQIILNLVSNAVKFTNHGKITVTVSLKEENDEQVTIEFAIKDTGIGIAADKMDKIFDNFQQASSGTSRIYGGTGLGLAIVKQLVEPQGGSINVTSVEGEGSTFSFLLNFDKTKYVAETENDTMEIDQKMKHIKVLVVEDIPLNQLLMKTLLDDFGFERTIAANGKIAIEKLKENIYDIILMDLQMPEMNGFEATDYIRNTMKSSIPIMALTADVTTVDLAKCKAVGMNDYIAKPVDEKLLYTKIINLVKKPESKNLQNQTEDADKKYKSIDLNYLTNRTKANPVLMMEMIELYLEQTPPLIAAMKQSLEEKNWTLLHGTIHKMLPSFSIVGISNNYVNVAKKIQEFARSQQEIEGIPNMVKEIENICEQACIELQSEYNMIKNKAR